MFRRVLLQDLYRVRGNMIGPLHTVGLASCSELILSAARLDYIADHDLDYVRIETSLD